MVIFQCSVLFIVFHQEGLKTGLCALCDISIKPNYHIIVHKKWGISTLVREGMFSTAHVVIRVPTACMNRVISFSAAVPLSASFHNPVALTFNPISIPSSYLFICRLSLHCMVRVLTGGGGGGSVTGLAEEGHVQWTSPAGRGQAVADPRWCPGRHSETKRGSCSSACSSACITNMHPCRSPEWRDKEYQWRLWLHCEVSNADHMIVVGEKDCWGLFNI